MGTAGHRREITRPGATFPRWAIDAGLRFVAGPVPAFAGTLPCSGAGFSLSRVGATTTLRAAAPAAAGLVEPVYAWWDPVYSEMACGARRVEHSDISQAFLSEDLRRALSDPVVVSGATDAMDGPVVAWTSGQVVVRWPGPADDPAVLGALMNAADAAVVAVRVARMGRLIDLDLGEDRPDCGHEEPSAFQARFWSLGVPCAPAVVLRGIIPGTTFSGRILWGSGPGGCGAAAVVVAVPDRMMMAVARRAEHAAGASLAGGCLVVVAAVDAPPGGLDLVDAVTCRTAALLTRGARPVPRTGVHSE